MTENKNVQYNPAMERINTVGPNPGLPQLVPSPRCLSCDVCCRFPEKSSPLAPYFTAEEIQRAIDHGIPPERFSDKAGCKIELIPHPRGEGCICPAFDPASNGCRIYEDRPLDCRLFPLALMWDLSKTTVLLGYDRKCPFVVEVLFDPSPYEYGRIMASRLESDGMVLTLRSHPGLVGAYQEDVMILRSLPRLGETLTGRKAAAQKRPSPESLGLTPLADTDRSLFESPLKWTQTLLSGYSWPALMVWKDHFKYYWAIIDRQLCLFAKYTDGLFMPLPPIGESLTEAAVRCCFEIMDSFNPNPALSRVENVDGVQIPFFEKMGLVVRPKEEEYLYDREALVRLTGDQYKAKRWACNRFERDYPRDRIRMEPYRSSDFDDCLKLYARWKDQHAASLPAGQAGAGNTEDRRADQMMMEDAASAHRRALEEFSALGLIGRVVRLGGKIAGYTFGYPFRQDIFCILLEVADREMTGLSAYLFREFCHEISGYPTIHAMGDSGLKRLAAAKRSYHPSKILTSYNVTRPI